MSAIDLFAGAGGWDLAARDLGIEAHGVENMKQARATRAAAGLVTVHDDVWTLGDKAGGHEGEIASPPCPTFSVAGKGTGRKALGLVVEAVRAGRFHDLDDLHELAEEVGDERTALVLTPLHYATKYEFEWLAWEQVPTVLPVWQVCAEALREQGFSVWTGNLHAEQYGVPQTRKRAFLLARRNGEVVSPDPTHSKYHSRTPDRLDEGVLPWVSMAEALPDRAGHLQRSNYSAGGGKGQTAAERGRSVRPASHPSVTVTSKGFGWLPEWAHRRPATTVVGTFHPEVIASPGFGTQVSRQNAPDSVRVTVQEAGVLQSFPAEYPWQGAKGKQYLQCGNAVPPLLAKAVLSATLNRNGDT